MSVRSRVTIRLANEPEKDDNLISELTDMVTARLLLRLRVDTLPMRFESIAADAVVKAYRRLYYEGITSETVGGNANVTTQFVSDILAEYEDEIEAYRAMHGGDDGGEGMVRFL